MTFESNLSESMGKIGAAAITGDAARGERAGIDAFRLADGRLVAWRSPDGTGAHEEQVAASLVRVAAEGAQRLAAIDADDTRTEAWKATERAKVAAETRARLDAATADALRIAEQWEAAEARDSVPPPLAAGDHAGALVDHECRAWLRSLDSEALVALAKELGEQRHARLLEAMMRSPVPLPPWIADAARAAWIERRVAADPASARQRRQAAERVAWLAGVRENVVGVVTSMAPTSSSPRIERVA